eukprot:8232222-Pyramimonas_sp.AAC.1
MGPVVSRLTAQSAFACPVAPMHRACRSVAYCTLYGPGWCHPPRQWGHPGSPSEVPPPGLGLEKLSLIHISEPTRPEPI